MSQTHLQTPIMPEPSQASDPLTDEEDSEATFSSSVQDAGVGLRFLMARKLADLVVLPLGHLDVHERSLVGDILVQILDRVDYDLRELIADRIAGVEDMPENVLYSILTDPPDVARPVIERTAAIADPLLIACARQGTLQHRRMLADRAGLTPAVLDELVRPEEPETAKRLMRRTDVRFAQLTVERLVAMSTIDDQFQTLLIERPELEPAHGFMMFWWVTTQSRQHLLARYALERAKVQDTLKPLYGIMSQMATPDPLVSEILALNDRRHRPRGLNGDAVSMDVVKRTLALSRQYPSDEIVEAVSLIAGISRELASRILRDPGGEPYAVMCKSLGVPRLEFLDFLASGSGGVYDDGSGADMSAERVEELLDTFDRMARDTARAVLRYWDWTGNPRIARITKLMSQNHTEEE